jgi:hypothetical protein
MISNDNKSGDVSIQLEDDTAGKRKPDLPINAAKLPQSQPDGFRPASEVIKQALKSLARLRPLSVREARHRTVEAAKEYDFDHL